MESIIEKFTQPLPLPWQNLTKDHTGWQSQNDRPKLGFRLPETPYSHDRFF